MNTTQAFASRAGKKAGAVSLRHITISTGDARDSFRNEVGRGTISALAGWIDNTIRRGRKICVTPDPGTTSGGVSYGAEIPGCPGFTAVITPHGENVMVSVIYGSASVATFAVAMREEGSTSLWNQLHGWAEHEGVMPVMTCAENPPAVPWCAAKLDAGIFQLAAFDALPWIGDFERCFAWTWIERNKR